VHSLQQEALPSLTLLSLGKSSKDFSVLQNVQILCSTPLIKKCLTGFLPAFFFLLSTILFLI